MGDVTRLRQILVNLINNAIKFTETGEVVVSVEAQPLQSVSLKAAYTKYVAPLYEVQFAVKDTGIGIPSTKLERLFKAFSQVDASTTRQYGGTGLGLVISKKLSELMGGKMWVESQPGVGSTFYFTIAAHDCARGDNASAVQQSLVGKRVLLVDDNDTNRKILTQYAHSWQMLSLSTASSERDGAGVNSSRVSALIWQFWICKCQLWMALMLAAEAPCHLLIASLCRW